MNLEEYRNAVLELHHISGCGLRTAREALEKAHGNKEVALDIIKHKFCSPCIKGIKEGKVE